MSPAARRLAWALGLSAALAAAWSCGSRAAARSRAERELVFSYVRGPLSDLGLGLTRDQKSFLEASAKGLASLIAAAPDHGSRRHLSEALALHQRLLALPAKQRKQALGELIEVLEELRAYAFEKWKLPTDRWLEFNALIYSLKELFAAQ